MTANIIIMNSVKDRNQSVIVWLNSLGIHKEISVSDIYEECKSGVLLVNLTQKIFDCNLKRVNMHPRTEQYCIQNIEASLTFLRSRGLPYISPREVYYKPRVCIRALNYIFELHVSRTKSKLFLIENWAKRPGDVVSSKLEENIQVYVRNIINLYTSDTAGSWTYNLSLIRIQGLSTYNLQTSITEEFATLLLYNLYTHFSSKTKNSPPETSTSNSLAPKGSFSMPRNPPKIVSLNQEVIDTNIEMFNQSLPSVLTEESSEEEKKEIKKISQLNIVPECVLFLITPRMLTIRNGNYKGNAICQMVPDHMEYKYERERYLFSWTDPTTSQLIGVFDISKVKSVNLQEDVATLSIEDSSFCILSKAYALTYAKSFLYLIESKNEIKPF